MLSYLRRLLTPRPRIAPLTTLPTRAEFEALSLCDRMRVFAGWVATKPPGQSYDFMNTQRCPMARFGKAVIHPEGGAGGSDFIPYDTHTPIEIVDDGGLLCGGRQTFGALHRRLSRHLA